MRGWKRLQFKVIYGDRNKQEDDGQFLETIPHLEFNHQIAFTRTFERANLQPTQRLSRLAC